MSSPSDIIAGATFRSDLQNTNRVLQAEWITLFNDAVDSTWNEAAAARPDFQVSSQDYTVASGGSASFEVPAAFHSLIDVVFGPDTTQEYSLGPFNWFNRRSPGGWYWPTYVGVGSGQGATSCRLMGWNVYLEPSLKAGGNYRAWFCPKPHTIVQTVRLATIAALPACTAAGAGVGKTLTANFAGALQVDGQNAVVGDKILVKNQVATGDNGVYTVTAAGSGITSWGLIRTPGYDTAATVRGGMATGDIVGVGQSDAALTVGSQEGKFFTLTTFTAIESAQAWTEGAAIDAVLERFVEVLKLKMTIAAVKRDGRGEVASGFAEDLAENMAQMRTYLANTRSNYPQKIIDTDAALFRGQGWGLW